MLRVRFLFDFIRVVIFLQLCVHVDFILHSDVKGAEKSLAVSVVVNLPPDLCILLPFRHCVFCQKILNFFFTLRSQNVSTLSNLLIWVVCRRARHPHLQAVCTLKRTVSPLASFIFNGQMWGAFPAGKLKQKYSGGKGCVLIVSKSDQIYF